MLERIDVEKLLKRLGIEARKRGKEWVAKCPNPAHDDKKPSFRVRDEPGAEKHCYFHCWPCSYKGGPLELVRSLLRLESHAAAREWILSGAAAIVSPAPIEVAPDVSVSASRPKLSFRLPPEAIFDPFDRWPSPPARFWTDRRGLLPEQASRWGVGYAVHGRLAGRVVIPCRDARGRPLSYTARAFGDSSSRYLQPEPRERARMSAMFGEQHWPDVEDRRDRVLFVVEGEINGLSLEAELGVGRCSFAATAGSTLRPLYASKLAGWGLVVVMTDADPAGDRLAEEIQVSLAREVRCVRLRLDDGVDANDLRVKIPGELASIVRGFFGS